MIRVIKPTPFQMKAPVTKKARVVFILHGTKPLRDERSVYGCDSVKSKMHAG
jgi:hypothetical protein